MPAPDDPTVCYAPCPPCSRRGEEILDLVRLGGRQLRVGFGGAYALDWPVFVRMADDLGLATDATFYEMLAAVEAAYMTALHPPKEGGGGGGDG